MQLIPDELKAKLPEIGSGTETPLREIRVWVRIQDPAGHWRWYILECDGESTFFGLVVSPAAVVAGRFTQGELENLRFDDGQGGETGPVRDVDFQPVTVDELARMETGLEEFLRSEESFMAAQEDPLIDLR